MRVPVGVGVGEGVGVEVGVAVGEGRGLASSVGEGVVVGVGEGVGWTLRLPKKKAPPPTRIKSRKKSGISHLMVLVLGTEADFGAKTSLSSLTSSLISSSIGQNDRGEYHCCQV